MSTSGQNSPAPSQTMFERFLHSEVAGSVVLVVATVIALIWANLPEPWGKYYLYLYKTEIGISWGEAAYSHTLGHWIKDGLMAIFFFVVGLEIKRELVVGELSSFSRALLPVTAALGGALIPAGIYTMINAGGPGEPGWGIPMATDIAFALGILALFGSRVPVGLKVFLAALAIADDLLAVLVIAFFYTATLNYVAIGFATAFLVLMSFASRFGLRQSWVYVVLAVCVWISLEASGIHATVAGVLIAMLVPVKAGIAPQRFFEVTNTNLKVLSSGELTRESLNSNPKQRQAVNEIALVAEDMMPPAIYLEKTLHSVQAFLILPLFALFSAGVKLDTETLGDFPGPVGLGIIVGLFVGKQVGICLFAWLATTLGGSRMPDGVTWMQIWGVSVLAGIGFTMSIFITELAFVDEALIAEAKVGILIASLAAGAFGYYVLNRTLPKRR